MLTGCMIVGAAPEPFLPVVLRGLEGAIDRLVVNFNGESPENRQALLESSWARAGRLHVIESSFQTFAHARNLCLANVDTPWFLNVDADEVHGAGLGVLTRGLLPLLPDRVQRVSITLVHFLQCLTHFHRMDIKLNCLIRRSAPLQWKGTVHEDLDGLTGETWHAPYACGHYGYCRQPAVLLEKWDLYHRLGDARYSEILANTPPVERLLEREVAESLPYHGRHPSSLFPLPEGIVTTRCPPAGWMEHLRAWHFQRDLRRQWRRWRRDLGTAARGPLNALSSELDERLGRRLPF